MGRLRNFFKSIVDTDNLILLLVGIGIGLVLTIFAPPLVPYLQTGIVTCDSLAPPSGGYSRSVLAANGEGEQELELDINLSAEEVTPGDVLEVDVVFKNNDDGPLILFIPETDILTTASRAQSGVELEFSDILNSANVTYYRVPEGTLPTDNVFDDTEIHLLRAHNRCSQTYEIEMVLPIGEYNVRAIYGNQQAGYLAPNPQLDNYDPEITTQGVWTSDEDVITSALRLTVKPEPTPTPSPIP